MRNTRLCDLGGKCSESGFGFHATALVYIRVIHDLNLSYQRCLNIWGGGGVSVFWVTLVRCLAGFIGGIFQGLGVTFG
ncbi:MAG TPA: hypothetical protein HA345_03695 [Candidatus Thalassarchaeaceae archaeon]|nr:hypothetical protein [Candidatus Thalassarchaeaceae archaeon]